MPAKERETLEGRPLSGLVVNGLFSFPFVRTCCNPRRIFLSSAPEIFEGDTIKTNIPKGTWAEDDILLHCLLLRAPCCAHCRLDICLVQVAKRRHRTGNKKAGPDRFTTDWEITCYCG